MKTHVLSSTAVSEHSHLAPGAHVPSARVTGMSGLANWLVDGVQIARIRPVLWLTAILGCADLATLLELSPSQCWLAALFAPLVVAAIVLMHRRASDSPRWSIREVGETVNAHSNALIMIGVCSAALVCAGQLISYAAFHVTMRTSVGPNGVHDLTFAYAPNDGAENALGSLFTLLLYAIAVSLVWFAPALVVLNKVSPLNAMTASLRAVVRNWRIAGLLGGAVLVDGLLANVVPITVQGLVVTPLVSALIVLSLFGSYREIFGER